MMIVNMPSGRISIRIGAKGLSKTVATACATGAHSIGDAFRSIQCGDADVVFAGGCEHAICDFGIGVFTSARTLSRRNEVPEKASSPYDVSRDGFVMSEGAGVLVLEELEHALKRGAKIYAEVAGYGATTDGYHLTAPNPNGIEGARAMTLALEDAHVKPEDVVYYNAHGTSTHLNDSGETKMLKNAFGDAAYKLHISSTK